MGILHVHVSRAKRVKRVVRVRGRGIDKSVDRVMLIDYSSGDKNKR